MLCFLAGLLHWQGQDAVMAFVRGSADAPWSMDSRCFDLDFRTRVEARVHDLYHGDYECFGDILTRGTVNSNEDKKACSDAERGSKKGGRGGRKKGGKGNH